MIPMPMPSWRRVLSECTWFLLCVYCIIGCIVLVMLVALLASPFLLLAWLAGGCP